MNECFPAGMLSDTGIRHFFKNGIDIYTDEKDGLEFKLDEHLHIGSVDLHFRHLHNRFSLDAGSTLTYELLKNHAYTKPEELANLEKLKIAPGEIVFTTTLEIVHLSEEFAALITGRSSIARLGIMVHCCQEFIHPGHGQAIPLQIINLSPYPVELDLTVPICQIVFFKLSSAASEKYVDRPDAKYSKETDPIDSRIYQDIKSHPKNNANANVNVNVNVGRNEPKGYEKTQKPKILVSLKRLLNKYITPFIPGIIMMLVITPFLTEYIVSKNADDIKITLLSTLADIPAPFVISFILLVIFIIAKSGEEL